jgi:predicted DNA-binding protein
MAAKRGTNKNTHSVLIYVPVELMATLKKLAEEDERSVSNYVVRLVRQHVKEVIDNGKN